MIPPVRTEAPAATPVSASEVKANSRIVGTEDDTFVGALIDTAVSHLDGWAGILGRCLVSQKWRQDFEGWTACRQFRLPYPDVLSVQSVTYIDADGASQTVASDLYTLGHDGTSSFIQFRKAFTAPSVSDDEIAPVSVNFTAGYGDAAAVPAAIRQAILLLCGHWYENREEVIVAQRGALETLPMAAEALLAPFRRVGL